MNKGKESFLENPLKQPHNFRLQIKHWHWNNYSKHVQHIEHVEPENSTSILLTGKALKCNWNREIDNELPVEGCSFWWKAEKWLKIFIKFKRNWLKNRQNRDTGINKINDANDWQMPRPLTDLPSQHPLFHYFHKLSLSLAASLPFSRFPFVLSSIRWHLRNPPTAYFPLSTFDCWKICKSTIAYLYFNTFI